MFKTICFILGEKWQNRRKILTPAFHFNVLQKYYPIVAENNLRLLEYLKKTDGKTFDIHPVMSEFTLHTICGKNMLFNIIIIFIMTSNCKLDFDYRNSYGHST